MIAIGRWDHQRNEPVAEALGCVHISHDQSGKNGAAVLARAVEEAQLNPRLCVGAQGDSTGHAEVQRVGLQDALVEKGLEREQMIISGCIRHFKELELKAAHGAWSDVSVENFMWTLRWVIHKDLPFWKKVWVGASEVVHRLAPLSRSWMHSNRFCMIPCRELLASATNENNVK